MAERRVEATGGAITGGTAKSSLGAGDWAFATLGWSDCGHDSWRTGAVLDPFMGSGTTALVARQHGRAAVGFELNPEYAELCRIRSQQLSLFTQAIG